MLTRKVRHFFLKIIGEQGGVMISFAILLPLLMMLIALALNAPKMFIAKSKLSDVAAEIGLIASSKSSVNEKETFTDDFRELTVNFVKEYFPESTKSPSVNIHYSESGSNSANNSTYKTYHPTIQLELPFPFYNAVLSAGEKNFTLSSSPITVKKQVARPIDLVFLVDFSTSQALNGGDKLLKGVVADLSDFVLSANPKSKIALVPYSSGVTVKYDEPNQRGGEKAGCSVLFVPKPDWAIDYAFWGDKYLNSKYKTLNEQLYYMDERRYNYYSKNVAGAKPALSANTLHNEWCRENPTYGKAAGRMRYSCFDKRFQSQDLNGNVVYTDDMFTQRSQQIVKNEYAKAARIQAAQASATKGQSIEQDSGIDYEATLQKMFSDEAIITFPMLWVKNASNADYRPFNQMCHHTGTWTNNNQLTNAKLSSWLIDLTNDKKKIDEFQTMQVGGWTATTSGLVRSVPVMMKGKNPRKVFVIITDGDDTGAAELVTQRYLKQYKLCDRIKEGILARPETNAERVDIYYVSTTNSSSRVKLWQDNCSGVGNAALAKNRNEVVDLIKGYLSDEIGNFTD